MSKVLDYIAELEKENKTLEGCLLAEQEHTLMLEKENKELQRKIDQLQGFLDHDIEYDIEQENLRLKEQIEKMQENHKQDILDLILSNSSARAELEQKLEQTEKDLADYQFNYPKIKELEQENAELKTELEEIKKRILPQDMCELMAEVKENYDNKVKAEQLTKAKEHIKTLISCLIDWVQEGDKDYYHIADAKQFLEKE